MSGLGDILFGSGGELETKSMSTMTPEQQALMKMLIGQLGGMGTGSAPGTSGGAGPSGTSGPKKGQTKQSLLERAIQGSQPQTMSPESSLDFNSGNFLSEAENTSLAGLEERAMLRATGGLEQQSMDMLSQIIQNRGAVGDPSGEGGFEDFFQTNVQDPALRDFETTVKPAIGRTFGGSSFFSSERGQADRNSSNDLVTSLTASRSKLAMDERNQSATRLLQAIGLAPEVDRVNTETRIKELDAFGTERAAREQRVKELLTLLNTQTTENLGGMTAGTTGLVQSFLGGGGGGALAGLIPGVSDRRLKENIERIGTTPGGIPFYRYNFIGDRAKHIGVMADEVEHIPGAVSEIRGIKHVDYSKIH